MWLRIHTEVYTRAGQLAGPRWLVFGMYMFASTFKAPVWWCYFFWPDPPLPPLGGVMAMGAAAPVLLGWMVTRILAIAILCLPVVSALEHAGGILASTHKGKPVRGSLSLRLILLSLLPLHGPL